MAKSVPSVVPANTHPSATTGVDWKLPVPSAEATEKLQAGSRSAATSGPVIGFTVVGSEEFTRRVRIASTIAAFGALASMVGGAGVAIAEANLRPWFWAVVAAGVVAVALSFGVVAWWVWTRSRK